MSNAATRFQYVYIEVKDDVSPKCVTLYGPTEVLRPMKGNVNDIISESLGTTMKMIKSGSDVTFFKAAFVEEVLKHGFVYHDAASSFKDDFIVFSRQVKL